MPWTSGLSACLSTPATTVVTPDECQSKPRTQPNAWNHSGSDSRLKNSICPYSSIITFDIACDSLIILRTRYAGAWPVWSGRLMKGALCNLLAFKEKP